MAVIQNGHYTIENAAGKHITLSVKTQKADAKFAAGKRVVAIMRGRDNEGDYKGFGFVTQERISVWRKAKQDSMMAYAATLLPIACDALADTDKEEVSATFSNRGRDYIVTLSKRCLVCNRRLTNPESLRRGIGPECYARMV